MAKKKFGAKEVMDVVLYDTVTGRPVIFFDTLKMSSMATTTQETFARGGKGNAKQISWEYEREATLNIEDSLLSPKSFEVLTGMAAKTSGNVVKFRQSTVWEEIGGKMTDKGGFFPLTASATGEISLAFTPSTTAANIFVYDADEDYETGKHRTGTLSGKTLTVPALANKKVVVYYDYVAANSEMYTISSDKFASTYELIGDTYVRNTDGVDERFQIRVPRAKIKSGFDMSFSAADEPSTFSFEVEVLKDPNSPAMLTMTKY